MHPSQFFFIGLTILILFGFKALIFCAFLYFIYHAVIESQQKKKKSVKNGIESWVKDFLKDFGVDDAELIKPKSQSQKPLSFNFRPMELLTPKRFFVSLIGIIFVLLILDGFVMIPAGQTGVILDRGRGVLEDTFPTGLHLKIPFWQSVTKMDTRLQTYTMSATSAEGEVYGNDAIEALTKDGQKVKVDTSVQFYLDEKTAPIVYEEVGLNYADKVVRPAARSVIRGVITGFNSKELFQLETRQEAQDMMVERMRENLTRKNLILDDILVRKVTFSEVYLHAIEEKQIAEQKIQKAEFEKQEAVIQKEKKIIEAEAESESIRLKGEALRNNPSVVQLEMVNKLAPNIQWGVLPDGVMPLLDMKQFAK
ncbi:prohibitin family protein [Candidatus Peregrinibacteria bacterium]|jgi:prohibitin 2|nr:prohibitin family protein [Candidatus Peregrinibacteria bacterium]